MSPDAELTSLIADARAPVPASLARTLPPPPHPSTFREIVEDAEARCAEAWATGGTERAGALRWAAGFLGPDAADTDVDTLARRRHTNVLINKAMVHQVELCESAQIKGPGAVHLPRAGGIILAGIHSGITHANAYAVARASSRTLYLPGDMPELTAAGTLVDDRPRWVAAARVRVHGEARGLRFVRSHRRLDVMRELLRNGEACAINVDAPGSGEATFFGRRVSTWAAAADLATALGVPAVVVTGYRTGHDFGVVVSQPLDPSEFASAGTLHVEILRVAEHQLAGDPSQLMFSVLPTEQNIVRARRLTRARAEMDRAKARLDQWSLVQEACKRELEASRSHYAELRRRVEAGGSSLTIGSGSRARRRLGAARQALEASRVQLDEVRDSRAAAREDLTEARQRYLALRDSSEPAPTQSTVR